MKHLQLIAKLTCVICEKNRATAFGTAYSKADDPAVTLLTLDNTKILYQLKSSYRRRINENKNSIVKTQKYEKKPKKTSINASRNTILRLLIWSKFSGSK